jgi:hypothetical protein
MAYIGSAPYLAGLSSKEARRLLEQTYMKPIRRPSAGVYWVDMDYTVIYLGDFSDAMKVMDSFHADDLCRFKHVALEWSQFDRLARACQRLARTCPALCTIIVHQAETKAQAVADGPFSRSLSLETAIDYATIPSHNNSELGYKGLDTDYLRSLLLVYFGASPPPVVYVTARLGRLFILVLIYDVGIFSVTPPTNLGRLKKSKRRYLSSLA